MKSKIIISAFLIAVFFAACSNSENKEKTTTGDSVAVAASPKTILKVTKQYVTDEEGSVTEMAINAEIGYNEQEVSVSFKDSVGKSFTMKVTSLVKKVEGSYLMLKDSKYKEVFVSSGAKPQITFSSDKGYGNMTFM